MRNLNCVQDALINIFKVGIKGELLEELVEICHIELEKLIGKDKTRNYFLAVHVENSNYILPYYKDEKDSNFPINKSISLKGGLAEYIRSAGQTELLDYQRIAALEAEGKIEAVIGAKPSEWIGAPLIYGNKVHGVLVIHTYDENVHYTREDVELIDYISRSIALALERNDRDRQLMEYKKNLEKEIKARSMELLKKNAALKREIAKVKQSEIIQKVLYRISEAKDNTDNLGELIGKIHEQISTLMDASNFYVAILMDKEKGLYRFPYIVDENPEEIVPPDISMDLSSGFTHYVMKTEKPLLADKKKVKELSQRGAVGFVGKPPQSWLGIPLKTDGGEILGVVVVQSYKDPNAFTWSHKNILSIISTTIAGAVYFKQLEENKKILEDKLLESQKMEAVGILAAGVAHEFNNLLSIIIGHAYNGMNTSKDSPEDYKRYYKIEKASERAAELIEKLMVFAQKRERGRAFLNDITRAIQATILKVTAAAASRCEISMEIADNLWPLRIDREEIDDILTNVLDNALRAVAERDDGCVKISAENFKGRPLDSPLKEICKYIYIRIEDNGSGIDEKTRKYIFNPFFTTRAPGEGTGMGLAIVYTIVKEYYGSIEVDSSVGKGTIVHIYLPITTFLS
jgi:signal transduction histidine kinase